MAIICDGYAEAQVSKENFINIQRAIGKLVDELHEEGFTSWSMVGSCQCPETGSKIDFCP
jgi:hypothetical protein